MKRVVCLALVVLHAAGPAVCGEAASRAHDRVSLLAWPLSSSLGSLFSTLIGPQVAEANPAKLAAARKQFAVGDIPGAARTLGPLASGGALAGAQLEDARKLFGICQFLLGNRAKTEAAFTAVLRANPKAQLDPKDVIDPSIGELFEQIRKKVAPRDQAAAPRAAGGASAGGRGAGTGKSAPPARAGFSGIFVKTNAENATVFAAGIFIGTANQDIALDPGEHKLTISAQDYEDITRAFVIKKNERLTLTVQLVKAGERQRRAALIAAKAKAARAAQEKKLTDEKKRKEKVDYTSDLPPGAKPSRASQSLADEFFRDQQAGMQQVPPPQQQQLQPPSQQNPYAASPAPRQRQAAVPPPAYGQAQPGFAPPSAYGQPPYGVGTQPVRKKKSLFLALLPFGVGQYQNGSVGLGVAVTGSQILALYGWYFFQTNATQFENSTPIICEDLSQADQQKTECTNKADFNAYLNSQKNYAIYSLAAFGALWGLGATEAVMSMNNAPTAPMAPPPPPGYYGLVPAGASGITEHPYDVPADNRVPVTLRVRPIADPLRGALGLNLRLTF